MLISVSNARLSIAGTPILSDVNLHMVEGEIYGLLGPNGAGKSSTLSLLTALRKREGGEISVMGYDPSVEPGIIKRRLGVLAENAGFYDWMNAPEYLGWFAGLYGREINKHELNDLLMRVGLDPENMAPIGVWSRGMKQRLGLARALVNEPAILILDEPTNGLDPQGRREIHDLLLDLNRCHGVGILLCTHILDDVTRLCSRVGIIRQGRTVLEGETAVLTSSSINETSYRLKVLKPLAGNVPLPNGLSLIEGDGESYLLSLENHLAPEVCWRILMASGWDIVEISREERSLEDVYIAAVKGEYHDSGHLFN